MKQSNTWTYEQKIRLVTEIIQGRSLDDVSQEHQVEKEQLSTWKNQFLQAGAEGLQENLFGKKFLLKLALVVLILGAGIAAYLVLLSFQKRPERSSTLQKHTLVETLPAVLQTQKVMVQGMGTVMPSQSIVVFPEVSGRIVYQSEKLIPGGRFKKGEILVRIDARDYDLAVKQAQARVVQARMELAREKGLKAVAEKEWSLIEHEVQPTEEGRKLALRDIQLENAQAMLDSAQSALDQARLHLDRTTIRAPFDCLVTEEFVDLGQILSPASKVAVLVAADRFWVQASLPIERLRWIRIPGVNAKEGSAVQVTQMGKGSENIPVPGRVLKLLGDLDPKGKMARLLIELYNPLEKAAEAGAIPLLIGAYVQLSIEGLEVQHVAGLPMRALRPNHQVWLKSNDNRLQFQEVEVVWTLPEQVFVRGLAENSQVILSRIVTPVEGMSLYTQEEGLPKELTEPVQDHADGNPSKGEETREPS